jgi:predicted flap endonuclease-1-like 5' DNA nuclease
MFVFGVLFWKLLSKNELENNDFFKKIIKTKNNKIKNIKYKKDNTYYNYESDSEITKDSIDIILDKKEDKPNTNSKKENINLKENNTKNKFIKKDNFKIIEWIWPKIEELLNNWGIYNYKDLANSKIEDIKNILKKEWIRYSLHNPTNWSKQADFINKWNFENLKIYQKSLKK